MKKSCDDLKYYSTDGCYVYGLAETEIAGIAGREMVVPVMEVRCRGLEQSDLQIYLFYSPSFTQVAQICVRRPTLI